ncbi:MAG: hypothetical protein KBD78_16720 [Oligoflexales bacterium]|nr:hypothetical protein [Oligoflexales bacterium]
MKISQIVKYCLSISMVTSCAPNLYFVDRHTVMEVEAAGEWPELDQQIIKQNKAKGVTYYDKDQDTRRKKRIFNSLHGEAISAEQDKKI